MAASRATRLLHTVAKHESTFEQFSGHLLLAFYLIGTTSASPALRRQALAMGAERARCWRERWTRTRSTLSSDTVMNEVIASYAANGLGVADDRIRQELQDVLSSSSLRDLLYFDPLLEDIPDDVPEDCQAGHLNARGNARCRTCRKRLQPRSRYEVWHFALTSAYFCERHGMALRARYVDVLRHLPRLKPYPAAGAADHYHAIYAVTHIVYTLNDYGRSRLSPRLLPDEFAFLKSTMTWALGEREPDTVGEIVDSLAAFGLRDDDPLLVAGRRFLLDTQCEDGGWGDEGGDEYAYFHTVWTGIDGLRDYGWVKRRSIEPGVRQVLARRL